MLFEKDFDMWSFDFKSEVFNEGFLRQVYEIQQDETMTNV